MKLRASAVALLVMLALSACAAPAPSGPRLLSTEEAQLLAVVRFKNFDAGTRSVSASFVDSDTGTDLALKGWFDYANDTGYATLTSPSNSDSLLLLWNGATIAAHDSTGSTALPPPDATPTLTTAWRVATVEPKKHTLHALAAVIETLGSDRPENPILLQQGGALWLRSDTIGTTPVTVFAGPPSTKSSTSTLDPDASGIRYWVNKDGLLLRIEVRLGAKWATVDFGPAAGLTIAAPTSTVTP